MASAMPQKLPRSTSVALLVLVLAAMACSASLPETPAVADPRWVPSQTNPAISRLDLLGSPSDSGQFRYLLRVPEGFSLAMHRHNTDLTAAPRTGEQRVVLQQPDGSTREVVLRPGDRLVIPKDVPHAEAWPVASVVEIWGLGPLRTTTP
jgi:hypothetical protein